MSGVDAAQCNAEGRVGSLGRSGVEGCEFDATLAIRQVHRRHFERLSLGGCADKLTNSCTKEKFPVHRHFLPRLVHITSCAPAQLLKGTIRHLRFPAETCCEVAAVAS